MITLSHLAFALGGEITNGQVLCPGPNHSTKDRSLAVRLVGDGFVAHSYSGDDWRECRDYISRRLGIAVVPHRFPPSIMPAIMKDFMIKPRIITEDASERGRTARACLVWEEAVNNPSDTLVEKHFAVRGLKRPRDCYGHALRFHPDCPWESGRAPAMVAAFRSIANYRIITGIHRTALSPDGVKMGPPKMLGIVKDAAIMLDSDEEVTQGLCIAEGVETALAARELGYKPCWALGSAGAIARFPVLSGIDTLTVMGETDDSGANAKAVNEVGTRWLRAGREVLVVTPRCRGDMNDVLKLRGAA